jgi:hypothetical protein
MFKTSNKASLDGCDICGGAHTNDEHLANSDADGRYSPPPSQDSNFRRFASTDEIEPPRIVAEHCNTENERLSIQRAGGAFRGQLVLCIHDDDSQGGTLAPMLLDAGTIEWLLKILPEFQQNGEPK